MVNARESELITLAHAFTPLYLLDRASEATTKAEAQARLAEVEAEHAELIRRENELFDMQGDLTDVTFQRQLRRHQERLQQVEAEVEHLAEQVNILNGDDGYEAGDAEAILGYAARQGQALTPEILREAAQGVATEIRLFAFHVEIELVCGETVRLERVPMRNKRASPAVAAVGLPESWGKDAHMGLTFRYKQGEEKRVIHEGKVLTVQVVGANPLYGEGRRRRGVEIDPLPAYVLEGRKPSEAERVYKPREQKKASPSRKRRT